MAWCLCVFMRWGALQYDLWCCSCSPYALSLTPVYPEAVRGGGHILYLRAFISVGVQIHLVDKAHTFTHLLFLYPLSLPIFFLRVGANELHMSSKKTKHVCVDEPFKSKVLS